MFLHTSSPWWTDRNSAGDPADPERKSLPAAPLDWLKLKNPEAPAVKREAEEDWGN
jgi:hypothetical protein